MNFNLGAAALLAALSLAGSAPVFAGEPKEAAPSAWGACGHELLWGKQRVRFRNLAGLSEAERENCGNYADLTYSEYSCLLKTYGAKDFAELVAKSSADPMVVKWGSLTEAVVKRNKEVGCAPVKISAVEQKAMTKALASLAKRECPDNGTQAFIERLQRDMQFSGRFMDTLGKFSENKFELRPISHDEIMPKWTEKPGTRSNSADFLLVDREARKGVLVVQAAGDNTTGEFICLPVTKAGSLGEGSGWSH